MKIVYALICHFFINYISWTMIRPINGLTRRIYKTIHRIKGLKQEQ